MRFVLAAGIFAALAAAAGVSQADEQPGWTYAYADGEAVATERDNRGRVTATLSCRPPEGDIVLRDFSLARAGGRASISAVRIGNMSVNVPSRVEGRGRNRALTINLPQRPPVLAGVQPSDRLSVTVGSQTRTYLEGSATRMKEVAYACWGS